MRISKEMVISETTLFMYCRQVVGIQTPTGKDIGGGRKAIKEIWELYPNVKGDYSMLANIADWASSRKRRYSTIAGLLGAWRYAASDGFLPQLDAKFSDSVEIQGELSHIQTLESDKEWLDRLLWASSRGLDTFQETVLQWETERLPVLIEKNGN